MVTGNIINEATEARLAALFANASTIPADALPSPDDSLNGDVPAINVTDDTARRRRLQNIPAAAEAADLPPILSGGTVAEDNIGGPRLDSIPEHLCVNEETAPVVLSELIEGCFVGYSATTYLSRSLCTQLNRSERVTDHGAPEVRSPIPDRDLKILERIYHGKFEDCTRKRRTLMRYIKFYRDEFPEPTDFFSKLKRQLERS